MAQELDSYSRRQLYIANRFMADNDINRSDLCVNQGHLPKWIDSEKNLQFGTTQRLENPRKIVSHPESCERAYNPHAPSVIHSSPHIGGPRYRYRSLLVGITSRTEVTILKTMLAMGFTDSQAMDARLEKRNS